jgi:hypothetical protein
MIEAPPTPGQDDEYTYGFRGKLISKDRAHVGPVVALLDQELQEIAVAGPIETGKI